MSGGCLEEAEKKKKNSKPVILKVVAVSLVRGGR